MKGIYELDNQGEFKSQLERSETNLLKIHNFRYSYLLKHYPDLQYAFNLSYLCVYSLNMFKLLDLKSGGSLVKCFFIDGEIDTVFEADTALYVVVK